METPGKQLRLSTRVARGGAWIFALRMGVQLFNILRLIILARLLAPRDFGLMGIALLGMATLQTFSEPGFRAALVQRKEGAEEYLDTAWTISLLRGAALCAILVLSAPYVASFFEAPHATGVIRAIALSLLLQGFTNIATLHFQKELEFKKQFIYQLSGTLVDFVVAVVAAVVLRNAWALVFGLLAGDAVRLLMSFAIARFRPRLELDWRKARELWSYGRWITGVSILVFLSTQGDNAVVGKMLGTMALGFYQLAYRICTMPATEFSGLISTVTFPAFSKVQDNLPLLRRSYKQVLQFTALLAFPAAAGIFAFAPEFTRIVLGEKWMPMVPAMRILAITGLCRSISGPGPLFMAIGKPKLRTRVQAVGFAAMAITIVPLTLRWGIAGAAVAATLRVAVGKSVALLYAVRELRADKGETAEAILFPLVNAAVCVAVVLGIKSYVMPIAGLWQLAVMGIVGLACYMLNAWLFDVIFRIGGMALVRQQVMALRRGRHETG
jgi:O-antigen/teichoic acid export membrane protein